MATAENPDFIELDMAPSVIAPANDAADAGPEIELDMSAPVTVDAADPVVAALLDGAPEAPAEAPAPVSDFAAIAAEASANAQQTSAGSLTDGTMRIVGFANAEGYVTALAHGVKAATAESYKQTLRQTYGFSTEQIAALTVTIIPEGNLPVGTGVVHVPTGPSFFEQRRIAAGLAPTARMTPAQVAAAPAPALAANPAPATVVAAITPGTIIASLLQDRSGKIFSAGRADRRATHRSRTEVVAALASIGRADLAPRLKTNKAQFGEVMRGLNAPGLRMRAWNVTRRDVQKAGQEWPGDLASRWCVGVLDGTDALGSLGEKVLIADLLENNEIRFTGGNDTMHQRVNEAFAARMGEQTYNATDLLNWFRKTMEEFYAVQFAGMIFVPGNAEATGPVCAFVNAMRPVLSRTIAEIDAVSGQGLIDGLAQGLLEEIEDIEAAYDLHCDLARKRDRAKVLKATPNASEADLELAERRAVVLPEAAGSILRRINEKSDKVRGYETMLGTDALRNVRALMADLRAKVEPLCDGTSAMAAAIELD